MEIVFLGTSSGTPTKSRNVSAIALKKQENKSWVLVDCGEGTQHQILHTNLALKHLSAILITHVHGDHCYGLPGLLASASMSGRTQSLTVIAPADIHEFILHSQNISQTFLTFDVNFIDVETLSESFDLHDFKVSVVPLSHRVPSHAYQFTEQCIERALDVQKLIDRNIPKGPLWGKVLQGGQVKLPSGQVLEGENYWLPQRKPRKIIVGGDNDTPSLLANNSHDIDVLIHESTFTQEIAIKVGPKPQHSSAAQVAKFAEMAAINNLILTHFSARFQYGNNQGSSISEIEEEARKYFTGNLFLANDFDRFYLDKKGEVILTASLQVKLNL